MKALAALFIALAALAAAPAQGIAANNPTIMPVLGNGKPPADPFVARTATEPVLGCLLGFGPWRCSKGVATGESWCGERYEQRFAFDCPEGPLVAVDYLGTNAQGADIYEARYRHETKTVIVGPVGADGKAWYRFRRGTPEMRIPNPLTGAAASAGKIALYRGVY